MSQKGALDLIELIKRGLFRLDANQRRFYTVFRWLIKVMEFA